MKKLSLFLFALTIISTATKALHPDNTVIEDKPFAEAVGFAGNTLVKVDNVQCESDTMGKDDGYKLGSDLVSLGFYCGLKPIRSVTVHDWVECFAVDDKACESTIRACIHTSKNILSCTHYTAAHYYLLITEGAETFICGPGQEFYDQYTNAFLTAKTIHQIINNGGKVALNIKPSLSFYCRGGIVKTMEFYTPERPVELYALHVPDCHVFPIGYYRFMVHDSSRNFNVDFGDAYFQHLEPAQADAVFQHTAGKVAKQITELTDKLKHLHESYAARNTSKCRIEQREDPWGLYPSDCHESLVADWSTES